MKVGLCDLEFQHITNPSHYTGYEKPKFIEWDRETPEKNKVVCFTERCYEMAKEKRFNNCIKVCWPLEPRVIHAYAYDILEKEMYKYFDYIFSFDENFRNKMINSQNEKISERKDCIFWTPGGSYIYKKHWQIYPKTKNLQIIASKKDWTVGHRLRHEVIKKCSKKIDSIYGRAYKYYDYQLEPFKDHRFAIVIENADFKNYWTDKLLDCFLTGTIPVMYNSGWIKDFFNSDGIILWENINELDKILDTLDDTLYNNMMFFIQENFHLAKKFGIIEDKMYHDFFHKFDK